MLNTFAAVAFVLPLATLAFAVPPAGLHRSRSSPALRMCSPDPPPWPGYNHPVPLCPRPESEGRARPVYGQIDGDVERLRGDVIRLECLVLELCGALVYSDDVALLERTTSALGPIYRDATFTAQRRPVFARKAVEVVLANRGLVAVPPMRAWRPAPGASDDAV